MSTRPPRYTRTDTLFAYTTLVRSHWINLGKIRNQLLSAQLRRILQDVSGQAEHHEQPEHQRHHRADAEEQVNGQVREMAGIDRNAVRSEEHTSELQSLMRISYAVFSLKKKTYAHHRSKKRTQ